MSSPRLAAAASLVLVSGLLTACDPLGGTTTADSDVAAGPGSTGGSTATPTVVANAAAVTVASGGLVQLNVTGTSLKSAGSLISCSWTQVANGSPMVALSSASSCTPSFMAPDVAQDSPFIFNVTGVDYNGNVGSDRITITVIAPPIDFITLDADGFAFIGLGELGLSLATTVGAVEEVGLFEKNAMIGNDPLVAIFNDRVHIVAPSDLGYDRDFEITLIDGDTTVTVPLHVPTRRATLFAPVIGAPDGADPENQASDLDLITDGLVPEMGNVLGGDDLMFSVELAGTPMALDPEVSSGVVTLDDGTFVADLNAAWTCNSPPPNCTALWIGAGDLSGLLGGQTGGGVLTLSLVSADFSSASIHEASVLVNPDVTINGNLIDTGGNPLGHADLPFPAVLVQGVNSGLRRIVPVEDDGTFEATDLIRDSYKVFFADPRFFGQMTVGIDATNPMGPFTITDWTIPDAVLDYDGPKLKADAAVESALYTSAVISGTAAQARANEEQAGGAVTAKAAMSDPANCNRQVGATTEFWATAAGEGQVITCEIKNYTPPAGTDEVLMEILIQSPEFPGYSPNPGNPYNDTWSYSVNATSVGMLMESGEVNISHRTTGLIRRTYCLTGSAISATGTMSVKNVGDSALATNVTVAFTPGCDVQRPLVELFVHRAVIGDMNTLSYSVSRSRQKRMTGDLGFNSLSVPFAPPSEAVGGVPLYVEYAPQDAVITGASLWIIDPMTGEMLSQSEDFIDQAGPGSNNGVLNFTDLELQFEEFDPPAYPLQAVVHLSGTVDGTPAGTFSNDPNVGFEGSDTMNFVPQTDVDYQSATKALINRRFGTRNEGGDGWAAPWTIDWLNGNSYLFNDISPLHVAQREFESRVRRFRRRFFASILGSTGHSDGSQIDLRYLDASGMATDFDGNDIQNLIKNAKGGSPAGLAAWVTANRAALEAASMDARSIIVGAGELGQALFIGRVGPVDLGVGRWDSRPRNILPSIDHLDRWTIALEAPEAFTN